jgi:hypothetical protein
VLPSRLILLDLTFSLVPGPLLLLASVQQRSCSHSLLGVAQVISQAQKLVWELTRGHYGLTLLGLYSTWTPKVCFLCCSLPPAAWASPVPTARQPPPHCGAVTLRASPCATPAASTWSYTGWVGALPAGRVPCPCHTHANFTPHLSPNHAHNLPPAPVSQVPLHTHTPAPLFSSYLFPFY